MAIVLGDNRYGKAETRLLRVTRRGEVHEIRELTVGVSLSGDFSAAHLQGDNSAVLPTDSQKNAVYAFAADAPVDDLETFALRLARHFAATSRAVRRATVHVDEHAWERIEGPAGLHPHAFRRAGDERRQARVVAEPGCAWAAAGLSDLVVLKSTGSEFRGFARDRYTTLRETGDRILATAVTARWRFSALDVDWEASFVGARAALLEARPEVAEVRLSLPNRHHYGVDVTQFGVADRGEVFQISDRPYGLIEGTVRRDGAPDGPALDW